MPTWGPTDYVPAPKPPQPTVSRAIREELHQTPAWWDRQYRALEKKQIPRSSAYHEDHEMVEERTYADHLIYRYCLECGVSIDDYEEN